MKQEKHKISVALCTYNGDQFVEEQIYSILTQSMSVDEIIICDDASIDNTVNICTRILDNSDIQHRIIRNKLSLGVTKNFEKCISLCTGDIIFLSDQDDIWDFNKVDMMVNTLLREDAILVFSNAVKIDSTGTVISDNYLMRNGFIRNEDYKKMMIDNLVRRQQSVNGCFFAFKKDFYNKITPIKSYYLYHDAWIFYFANALGNVSFVNKELVRYRVHDTSETQGGSGHNKWYEEVFNQKSEFDRRFVINKYREERTMIMKNVIEKTSEFAFNRDVIKSYKKAIALYERLVRIREGKYKMPELQLIKCACEGLYNYRILDRSSNNSMLDRLKILICDLIFISNYEYK